MTIPSYVHEGDLITAKFTNGLIDAIKALDARLSLIETSGGSATLAPVLTSRLPGGDVPVGSALTLLGGNFLRPSELNTVMLGSVPINAFDALSNAKQLIFQVPNVFTGLPKIMPVSVTNQNGTSQALQVQILPLVQTQGGQVVVFDQTQPLGTILVGSTYTLAWLVDSQTVLPATYTFTVIFNNVNGASTQSWLANTIITPTGQQQIARGNPLTVTASITVPANAVSADVVLGVDSIDRQFTASSSSLTFTVGAAPPVSDTRALLTIGDITPLDPITSATNVVRTAKINGQDGLEIQFGTTGHIPIHLHVTGAQSAAGIYTFSAEVENPAGLWIAGQAGTIRPPNSQQSANTDNDFLVQIQNTDAAKTATVKQLVVRASHRPSTGSVDDFVSFIRFPIRGYSPS